MATTIITKYGSGAPAASDVVRGELAVDTENGRLYTENIAGSVVEIGLNPSGNVDVTGTVTASGGDFSGLVQFNGTAGLQLDNAAQVHSWTLDDNFTSRLNIGTSSASAAWKIGSNNNAYLTVSPTGIDVTGTVTADGLTVDHSVDTAATFTRTSANTYRIEHDLNQFYFWNATTAEAPLLFQNDGDVIMNAGNVGIGTASPDNLLHLHGSPIIRMTTATTGETATDGLIFGSNADGSSFLWTYENEHLYFGTNNTERVRITEAGSVGIGVIPFSAGGNGGNLMIGDPTTDSGSGLSIMSTTTGDIQFGDANTGTGRYAGLIRYQHSDNSLVLWTNSIERMRIDSSGNVGIGVSSPTGLLTLGTGTFSAAAANTSALYTSTTAGLVAVADGFLLVDRAGADVFKVDTDGNLLVGTATGFGGLINAPVTTTDEAIVTQSDSTSASTHLNFRNPNGFVGSISTSGTATAYNTSSDYRLKENVVDAPSASDDIDAIQVRSFDWKADGSHQKYGMVAQELQTVAPEAVSQPEDPEEMMGVDYSKLVPMMLKEIQQLRARVAQLEGAN